MTRKIWRVTPGITVRNGENFAPNSSQWRQPRFLVRLSRRGLLALHQILDVPVRVKKIDRTFLALGDVKFFLVQDDEDLGRGKNIGEHLQMIRVLAIEEDIPGITGAGQLEQFVVVRRTTEDV